MMGQSRNPCSARVRTTCSIVVALAVAGCGQSPKPVKITKTASPPKSNNMLVAPIDLPQPSQRLGTAVVVLIDTSGSMTQQVADQAGRRRQKNDIARSALERIVQVTNDWHQKHPDPPLYFGIIGFSGVCTTALPIDKFDANKAKAAVSKIPRPAGGTAIGDAIEEGFQALYGTGCIRKHLVCITDGQNTVSTPPDLMARQLYAQTNGAVEIHFVAFDTSADKFTFLKNVNGSVVEAADGAQLENRLIELYEKRILVEAMPAEKE